jgi:hypothetical protein
MYQCAPDTQNVPAVHSFSCWQHLNVGYVQCIKFCVENAKNIVFYLNAPGLYFKL